MKVFISWSGERSKQVAELLKEWLQCVIQAVEPWISSKDIERGALWFSEINDVLASTYVGIVCLTQENKNKPWILFESGALAKGLSQTRVITFLVDLEPTDLQNPLAQFNHTQPSHSGLWNLVSTINRTLKENALNPSILEKVFETYFPQFEVDFKKVLSTTPNATEKEKRTEPEILLEVLSSIRNLEKRILILDEQSKADRYLAERKMYDKFNYDTKFVKAVDVLNNRIEDIEKSTQDELKKIRVGSISHG